MGVPYADFDQFSPNGNDSENNDLYQHVPSIIPDIGESVSPPQKPYSDSERERILREHFEALDALISLGPVS